MLIYFSRRHNASWAFMGNHKKVITGNRISFFKKLGAGSPGSKFFSSSNLFFANNSRQNGNIEARMVPNDLSHQDASEDMHVNFLAS